MTAAICFDAHEKAATEEGGNFGHGDWGQSFPQRRHRSVTDQESKKVNAYPIIPLATLFICLFSAQLRRKPVETLSMDCLLRRQRMRRPQLASWMPVAAEP
jgi:hypothetical protein